ncbi:MAG: lipoyl(octanoyl) transferase LipB [Pseudomonadota bacterium]
MRRSGVRFSSTPPSPLALVAQWIEHPPPKRVVRGSIPLQGVPHRPLHATSLMPFDPVIIRPLGQAEYNLVYQAMHSFTDQRTAETLDEIWIVEHPAVYTLGLAGKPEHLLNTGDIPIHRIDRGGQVTYHGIGQLVVYILMDIKRRGWGVRQLVTDLEQAIIDYLATFKIHAVRREHAPGVYADEKKIAALGLRIRRGCSYHGLSLNVNMDLSPFSGINPCGYKDLQVNQLYDYGISSSVDQVSQEFLPYLLQQLRYQAISTTP